ncbi:MAG: hypothetical protein AB1631_28380 [Acidobacteriota bacterium]
MRTTTKKDRIDRALDIVRAGQAVALYPGAFLVKSQSSARVAYTITGGRCPCRDARRGICKHLMATIGAPALVAIGYFRAASSVEELRALGVAFAAHAPSLPAGFVALARSEFRSALTRLRAGRAFDWTERRAA